MCGLGQWGPNLLRNLRENPDCEVAVLCDADSTRLKEFAEFHPDADLVSSVEEVAARTDIEAVVLATPAGLHGAQVALLLNSGKDVLVEKPLALTVQESRSLVELARSRSRVLMVGHTFLFNPAVRQVRSEIEKGTLGTPKLILAQRLSLGRIRGDVNALWNLAPHDISILLAW